jgi:hypothetical protein
VVVVGNTIALADDPGNGRPLMFSPVAPVAVQVRVTLSPGAGETVGFAVNEVIDTGGAGLTTVIVAVDVEVPVALVAVRVYVVVVVGDTLCDPVGLTVPSVGEIVTLVALVTVQVSVELAPRLILGGFAAKVAITGKPVPPPPPGGPTVTITPHCVVDVPLLPLAVIVYAVVCVGVTVTLPVAGSVPMFGWMITLVEFAADQFKVADCPAVTVVGLA